jgi:hypothetical protein
MKIRIDKQMKPTSTDQTSKSAASGPDQGSAADLPDAIEAAINRRLARKLGCKPEEVDLMLPSGKEEPVQ